MESPLRDSEFFYNIGSWCFVVLKQRRFGSNKNVLDSTLPNVFFFRLLGESNGGYQVIHLIHGNWICSSVMLQHLGLPTHPYFTQVPKMEIVAKDIAGVPGKRSTTPYILDFV